MYFDCDDELRWAMRLKAGKDNIPSLTELAIIAVKAFCEQELREVKAKLSAGAQPPATKSKRGRKPKPD